MERLQTACCGLDVHKRTVVACVLRPDGAAGGRKETRTFATMTDSLEDLRDWLVRSGCTHLAMESTGSYGKPVYHVLKAVCPIWLVHAQHSKNVPGRKTDVQDAEWIAELLQHGLLRPSFI